MCRSQKCGLMDPVAGVIMFGHTRLDLAKNMLPGSLLRQNAAYDTFISSAVTNLGCYRQRK